MLVELAAEIFSDNTFATNDPGDLYSLLRAFAKGPHDWVTDSDVVAAVEPFLPKHLPMLAGTYTALARNGMVAQRWVGTTQTADVVRVGPADLADHAADLCQAAVLVVENRNSDGNFVATIAHVFGADRVLLALEEKWLVIRLGGGSSLVSEAEDAANGYRRVVRVAALLDSDRMIPQQRTPNHDKADRLAKRGVATHVLSRREIENYAPNRVVLSLYPPRRAARMLTLLKGLSEDQRAHFDMKNGFRKHGAPPAILAEQADLFDGLDPKIRRGLQDGFGNELIRRMHDARTSLTEHDFAQLGSHVVGELRALLATIASKI